MTIWDMFSALTRRWYVVAFGFALGLAGSAVAVEAPGVYWSRAEVTFLPPSSAAYPNVLPIRSSDLVITAGMVAKLINGNITWTEIADPSATIVGQGIYDGWTVRLPDYGGQWSRDYPRQVLDIQVSGPSEQVVRQRQQELIARVDAELAALQAGVLAGDRITTIPSPLTPQVHYFGGSRVRALAMIWVLTGSAVLTVVMLLEQRNRRQTASPHGSHHHRTPRQVGQGERAGAQA